jgi:magnesium transporter
MTIIAARRYQAGKPTGELDLAADGAAAASPDCFDWIGLHEPGAEELALLQRRYGLHPLAIEDATSPSQVAKLDIYGDQVFIVARTASNDQGEMIAYGQTSIFVGRQFIVTVRLGSQRAHSRLRERLEAHPEHLAQGPDFVAHAVLDFIVDGYAPIADMVEEAVLQMEERAIARFPEPSTIRRVFRLRRQLRRFENVVHPMADVCEKLLHEDLPAIDTTTHVWFRDVLDHVARALMRVRGLQETLASIVETAGLLEQHRQGEMMRKLAAWAAILAVPTAIAGIYGMNFRFMPELQWQYGYAWALGVITVICGGLWWRFKAIGWL